MNHFSDRHQVQEHLVSQTGQGVIVELGCGYGNGVRAMCRGNVNGLEIYSIDPYLPYSDPLGGKYGEETYQEMLANTAGLPFILIRQSAMEVVRDWRLPIGLLWVDLSMRYEDLWLIVHTWEKWVSGYVAITGLEYHQLGTRRIYEELPGYDKVLTEQNLVAVMRKR